MGAPVTARPVVEDLDVEAQPSDTGQQGQLELVELLGAQVRQ